MQIMNKLEETLISLRSEMKKELLTGRGLEVHKRYNDLVHDEYYEITKRIKLNEITFALKFTLTKTKYYTVVSTINEVFKDLFDDAERELFFEVVSNYNANVDTNEELEYYRRLVKELERKQNGIVDEYNDEEDDD